MYQVGCRRTDENRQTEVISIKFFLRGVVIRIPCLSLLGVLLLYEADSNIAPTRLH